MNIFKVKLSTDWEIEFSSLAFIEDLGVIVDLPFDDGIPHVSNAVEVQERTSRLLLRI